jgi:hypothetical protein
MRNVQREHRGSMSRFATSPCEFSDEEHATAFERFLKSGSGRAFAKRHFD